MRRKRPRTTESHLCPMNARLPNVVGTLAWQMSRRRLACEFRTDARLLNVARTLAWRTPWVHSPDEYRMDARLPNVVRTLGTLT